MPSMRSQAVRLLVKYLVGPAIASGTTLRKTRFLFESLSKVSLMPRNITIKPERINNISAEWVSGPEANQDKIILYFHGGCFVQGSPATHRDLAARLSITSGARILLINYRLAPENPFPAGLEDCVTAYKWLLAEGFNPEDIVIAGDSAGGGLTIATLVTLRDEGIVLPAAAVCLSPWVDLENSGESHSTRAAQDPMLNSRFLEFTAKLYVGDRRPDNPSISPIHADLKGLPPLLIHVGGQEILLSDARRLEAQAKNDGISVTLEQWDDMWHVWHIFAGMMPEGQQGIERIGLFIRQHHMPKAGVA